MSKISLINGWSAGETPDGRREWSISLHYQPEYKGERTFLSGTDGLLVGVEIDNPSSNLRWKDLVSISDLLSESPSGYTVNPAFGLIYIKYLGGDSPPDSAYVVMKDVMSVGMVTQTRADALQEKGKASSFPPKRWWLWIFVPVMMFFLGLIVFFDLIRAKDREGGVVKKYKRSLLASSVFVIAVALIAVFASK